ncbi:MAG: glycosyltransferase family 2 protein [Desulfobacterales bacterium]|nr:glycosyltransferase family 2 protein [Desulfobacterales bacterium]
MFLVILIPCFNEENTIRELILSIPKSIKGITKIEIIVIDDGSSDHTASRAEEAGAFVISHFRNMGVGAAFNTGVEKAIERGADIVVNIDGDGQFDPGDISCLIQPIIDGEAEFVTASRFMDKNLEPEMPVLKKWGNKRISSLISFLTKQQFHDVSCGFRAYSKEVLLKLNLMGKFTYTQETFLDLAFKEVKILEVPIKVKGEREYGQSRVAGNLWKYAINASKIIFRSFRDYQPFKFFFGISIGFFVLSFFLGTFFVGFYLVTGHFHPHKWAGFTSGFLLLFSLLFLLTALQADMFVRIRQNQEKLLYLERKKIFNNMHAKNSSNPDEQT